MIDQRLIDEVVQRIVERFHPRKVVVFGSHARGDADSESDLDLFVETETSLRPPERAIEISRLFGLHPWPMDIVYTRRARRSGCGASLARSSTQSSPKAKWSMSGPESTHRARLAKAANDVLNIENNLASERIPWDTVCFHAQQATEKILKAFLILHGQPLSRTHDLVALLAACVAVESSLAKLEPDCRDLTYFAVDARYPEQLFEPDEQQAHAMVAAMKRVRACVLPLHRRSQDAT